MKRIRAYFEQFEKEDWMMVGYFAIILFLVVLLPVVWLWDYTGTAEFQWRLQYWRAMLTKSLQNWWLIAIDTRWLMW